MEYLNKPPLYKSSWDKNRREKWLRCQKKTYAIPKSPSVELILCYGSVVNFFPKNHNIGRFDAGLVCATNETCEPICQASVTEAVAAAGGLDLEDDVSDLPVLRVSNSGDLVKCLPGHAVKSSPHAKYYGALGVGHVIYAVGPTYGETFMVGEERQAANDEMLQSAYLESLDLAEGARLQAVAFSLMSAGKRNNNYDSQRAFRVAVKTILEYNFKSLKEVHLCAYSPSEHENLLSILAGTDLPEKK